MNYKPLSNRIVGKTVSKKEIEKTKSGLFIPVNVETQNLQEIEVVAVGRGYATQSGAIVPMETKIGDIVLVPKLTPLKLPSADNPELKEGEEYVVFQESDIYVVVGRKTTPVTDASDLLNEADKLK